MTIMTIFLSSLCIAQVLDLFKLNTFFLLHSKMHETSSPNRLKIWREKRAKLSVAFLLIVVISLTLSLWLCFLSLVVVFFSLLKMSSWNTEWRWRCFFFLLLVHPRHTQKRANIRTKRTITTQIRILLQAGGKKHVITDLMCRISFITIHENCLIRFFEEILSFIVFVRLLPCPRWRRRLLLKLHRKANQTCHTQLDTCDFRNCFLLWHYCDLWWYAYGDVFVVILVSARAEAKEKITQPHSQSLAHTREVQLKMEREREREA